MIAYHTFNQTPPPNSRFGRYRPEAGEQPRDLEILCTNPAALGGGAGPLDTLTSTEPFPGFVGAATLALYGGMQPTRAHALGAAPGPLHRTLRARGRGERAEDRAGGRRASALALSRSHLGTASGRREHRAGGPGAHRQGPDRGLRAVAAPGGPGPACASAARRGDRGSAWRCGSAPGGPATAGACPAGGAAALEGSIATASPAWAASTSAIPPAAPGPPQPARPSILLLATSPRFSVARVRVGDPVAVLRRRLVGERRVVVRGRTWFVVRGRRATLLFRTRSGKVRAVGTRASLADPGAGGHEALPAHLASAADSRRAGTLGSWEALREARARS